MFSSPAVANGIVYVGSIYGELYAFDAAGVNGCSGIPKTCLPLWTDLGFHGGSASTHPSGAGGRQRRALRRLVQRERLGAVRVRRGRRERLLGHPEDLLAAVDRPRPTPTSSPRSRSPTAWSMPPGMTGSSTRSTRQGAASPWGSVATRCGPRRSSAPQAEGSPAVANGVVYVARWTGSLSDVRRGWVRPASVCALQPVAEHVRVGGYIDSSPVVANGMVYQGSAGDNSLHAFALP